MQLYHQLHPGFNKYLYKRNTPNLFVLKTKPKNKSYPSKSRSWKLSITFLINKHDFVDCLRKMADVTHHSDSLAISYKKLCVLLTSRLLKTSVKSYYRRNDILLLPFCFSLQLIQTKLNIGLLWLNLAFIRLFF